MRVAQHVHVRPELEGRTGGLLSARIRDLPARAEDRPVRLRASRPNTAIGVYSRPLPRFVKFRSMSRVRRSSKERSDRRGEPCFKIFAVDFELSFALSSNRTFFVIAFARSLVCRVVRNALMHVQFISLQLSLPY